MGERTWPQQWFDWRDGDGCPKCAQGRPERDKWGARFYVGAFADGYLQNPALARGYSVVVFRGRHVADLVDLTDAELAGYWADVRSVARLLYEVFEPCHLNYQALGNFLPHLHTHVVPAIPTTRAPAAPSPNRSGTTPPKSPRKSSPPTSRPSARPRDHPTAEPKDEGYSPLLGGDGRRRR